MTSYPPIPRAARPAATDIPVTTACRFAPVIIALCLAAVALLLVVPPSPARAETPVLVYYSDLIRDAVRDPAFADSGYKTRRDVLTGIVGPETWVEHFILEGDVIEALTYNSLIYGVIIKKKNGTTQYWAVSDDKKTYTLSEAGSPSGWTIKNPPSYDRIIEDVKNLIKTERYDDAVVYISEVMRNAGIETAQLYFYRGFAYDQLSEYSYAALDYRRAISLDQSIADAYFNLGIIYRNEGNAAEAVALFERYLELYPNDPRAQTIRDYINANK